MANVSFTRDEVILALDVLYFSGEERLNEDSPAIHELSDLLVSLPIHPMSARGEIFRNYHGVADMIATYRRSKNAGRRDRHVGAIFYDTGLEYENRLDELHAIAQAIRRNVKCFSELPFGNKLEIDGFPEGALLGHLHKVIEKRDGGNITEQSRCEICQIETLSIYKDCPNLLERHLTVPITELDGNKRYGDMNFITVCPNCHAALHRHRPWLTQYNCDEILC